jgi:hypothetical protein
MPASGEKQIAVDTPASPPTPAAKPPVPSGVYGLIIRVLLASNTNAS